MERERLIESAGAFLGFGTFYKEENYGHLLAFGEKVAAEAAREERKRLSLCMDAWKNLTGEERDMFIQIGGALDTEPSHE